MFAYELHELRSAELRRLAEQERLAAEALRGRRAARRTASREAPEAESHSGGPGQHRFTRAA
ncbi:hypothetical protein [Streptomyces sp. PsTaAH-124]|uniref:hypothetical protein n=1 Tax=Streptomyces sp. PsTaAH-124 TaxID=1157638 RepID=UPI0003691150|nr:hypothetical protein [Streptomyces sp. PsTaAH-124]